MPLLLPLSWPLFTTCLLIYISILYDQIYPTMHGMLRDSTTGQYHGGQYHGLAALNRRVGEDTSGPTYYCTRQDVSFPII
jgi:hypothetical protein